MRNDTPRLKSCSRPKGVRISAPRRYFQSLRNVRLPDLRCHGGQRFHRTGAVEADSRLEALYTHDVLGERLGAGS